MQATIETSSTLNGCFHDGDYIWAGAMNLCWTKFQKTFLEGSRLQLMTNNSGSLRMIKNFQETEFTTNDLDSQSYYVHAGHGPAAVKTINTQCRQKFPNKTFGDLQLNLKEKDLISYAYFFKSVQYKDPFEVQKNFNFNQTTVKGFSAANAKQKNNVLLVAYKSDNDFTVKLSLKQVDQELYIVKGSEKLTPQAIVSHVIKTSHKPSALGKSDQFAMPCVKFDIHRNYTQLVGLNIANKSMSDYVLSQMFENIKFQIDEVGAKVENQAVMVATKTCAIMTKPVQPKYLIVNKPFWVVMRQKGRHPYFISQVNGHQHMTKA